MFIDFLFFGFKFFFWRSGKSFYLLIMIKKKIYLDMKFFFKFVKCNENNNR